MKHVLTIALAALLLTGCVAQWPSHRTGSRWVGGPDVHPLNASALTMPAGNSASGDPIGDSRHRLLDAPKT